MEKLGEVLWASVKTTMDLVYQIWVTLVGWWENICKKPAEQPIPLEPREEMHELDIDELSKVIYYYKPKQT